jgi:LPXTG-motif cell wall-anchored protein
MGAAKNIWGAVTGLFPKPKAVKSVAKSTVKTLDSNSLKTTAKTLGDDSKLISGGQTIAKDVAKSKSTSVSKTLIKVGKNTVVGTGILAIPAAAGIYGYDLFKNVTSRDDGFYDDKNDNKNYANETQNLKDRLTVIEKMKQDGIGGSGDTNNYMDGGSTTPDVSADSTGDKNIMWYVILGVAALGAGTYIYSKSRSKK